MLVTAKVVIIPYANGGIADIFRHHYTIYCFLCALYYKPMSHNVEL